MLKTIIYLIIISLLTISIDSMAQSPLLKPNTTKEKLLDQIALIVNNEIVTQSAFNRSLAIAKQQFTQNHISISNKKVFRKQVINQLIYQKLQLQLAKRNKLKASNEEINMTIAGIAAQNQLSQSSLKEKLMQQGISYMEFRKQIQKQLLISKLQQQVIANNITVSKSDIVAFRKQHQIQIASTRYHIATILIPVTECATQAQINHAKCKAFLILKQLHKGLDFKYVMSTYPGSSDLGWRLISDLPQIFASSIRKIKLNEVIGPIQASNGFHLIKLLGKEIQDMPNSHGQQIQQAVYQKKFEKALRRWLWQLRRSSYIRIYINS